MADSIPRFYTANENDGQTSSHKWRGGVGYVFLGGTFATATITLQYSPNEGTTWVSTSFTATAVGAVRFDLPPGDIRLDQSGSTAESVDAWVGKVHPHGL